jgi:hypothetical protein
MKKAILLALGAILLPTVGFAVDGVVLINQSTVMAAGGFPYTISQPGSYKLSGNLVVPNLNTTAIRIATDFVTIDMAGFSIIGPNDCSSGTCQSGSGDGIDTLANHVYFNLTIRNGTIQGMGRSGLYLWGDSMIVEYVHARSNGFDGIFIGRFDLSGVEATLTTVQYCDAELNQNGITAEGGHISHSNGSRNRLAGIRFGPGLLDYNVASHNGVWGVFFLDTVDAASYLGNVFKDNGSDNIALGSGAAVNMGQNLCGNTKCPGALY